MSAAQECPECGAPLPNEAACCESCTTRDLPKPPRTAFPTIPGYNFVRVVGEGGMGVVYLAEEAVLGRRVAIKMISAVHGFDPGAHGRFQREARTMATVEHPNVVRVHTFGEAEGRPYFVMEYVDGGSLAQIIKHQGPLPVESALRILRCAVDALRAAAEKGIVHRDVKPGNIFIDQSMQVKVGDFGLAKMNRIRTEQPLTQSGYFLGTPHYMSPEHARGQAVDFRSDIYSMGVVFYEMLTGSRPFDAPSPYAIIERQIHQPLPRLNAKRPDAPRGLQLLIDWMTEKDADRRPASYGALLEAIGRLQSDGVLTVSIATPVAKRGLIAGRRFGAYLLLGCFLAAGTVVAVRFARWQSGRSEPEPQAPAAEEPHARETPRRYSGAPFSVDFVNAPLRQVLLVIADFAQLNMIVDPNVPDSTVAVNFREVPWDQALDVFCRQNGLAYTVQGNVIRVGRTEDFIREQREREELDRLTGSNDSSSPQGREH